MPTTRPLNASGTVVLDANGTGEVRLGPQVYGETWRVRRMVVYTGSSSNSEARVYLNGKMANNLVAGTYSGDQDFNETDIELLGGNNLICEWTFGTAADVATFSVQGSATR